MKNKITLISIFLFFGIFPSGNVLECRNIGIMGGNTGTIEQKNFPKIFTGDNSVVTLQSTDNFQFTSPLSLSDLFSEEDMDDDLKEEKIKCGGSCSVIGGDFNFPGKNSRLNYFHKNHTDNSCRFSTVKTHVFYCVHRL